LGCSGWKLEKEKETEIDLLQDGSPMKREKNNDHHGPRPIRNVCIYGSDPLNFSLYITFKDNILSKIYCLAVEGCEIKWKRMDTVIPEGCYGSSFCSRSLGIFSWKIVIEDKLFSQI
jgi:hypothetical protein